MKKYVPREKLGKRARKQLDSEQRATWAFSPVSKRVESKKLYNRKKQSHDRYDDYGVGFYTGIPFINWLYFISSAYGPDLHPLDYGKQGYSPVFRLLCSA